MGISPRDVFMYLAKEKLQHINGIAHEGKVVVVATDGDGKLFYTIKQDGFEDTYLNSIQNNSEKLPSWEDWKQLELPKEEKDDKSVVDKETEELTYGNPQQYILRSLYRTQNETAVAPVQLVSGNGQIYIFRQSKANTLMCDRFVLDGMSNTLVQKLEVRFKRSRQKNKPIATMKKTNKGLQDIDTLDFKDANGVSFYEPTTEICYINNLKNGWFSVVLIPTKEQDKSRWHIFAYNSVNQKVEMTSILCSDEGLFDVKDYTVLEPNSNNKTLIPRKISGIIKRIIDLPGITVNNGLAATKYDIQSEQQTDSGDMQLIRDAVKIMLAIPTSNGNVAAISFSVRDDGTLSRINESPNSNPLIQKIRELLLPLNTLDNIKSISGSQKIKGTLAAMKRGGKDDIVTLSSSLVNTIETGDTVKISDVANYSNSYKSVTRIDNNTFEIDVTSKGSTLGNWEVIPKQETGLIYDGMIVGYEVTPAGKMRVTAINHGLSSNDTVQIVDNQDLNHTYTVTKIDDTIFTIDDLQWQPGTALNIKLEAQKRRGITLDGLDDYIELEPDSIPVGKEITITFWAKGGITLPKETMIIEAMDDKNQRILGINLPWSDGVVYFDCGKTVGSDSYATLCERIQKAVQPSEYKDQWNHWAFTKNVATGEMKIYCNGNLWQSDTGKTTALGIITQVKVGRFCVENRAYYDGQLAELCIWDIVRTEAEIRNAMNLQLTGKEVGLTGYWRLGGIVEGPQRKVLDLSINARDGIVYGGAYIGGKTLDRKMKNNTLDNSLITQDLTSITRGILLDGVDDYIEIVPASIPTGQQITISFWAKGGSTLPKETMLIEAMDNKNQRILSIHAPWSNGNMHFFCGAFDTIEKIALPSQFKDRWTHWTFTKNATTGEMKIYCDGVLWQSVTGKTVPIVTSTQVKVGRFCVEKRGYYDGQIAELSIWNVARTEVQIKATMYQQLVGNETGLTGYWKLDNIVEGPQRKVIDSSINKRDGIVYGGANINISQNVIQYFNDDLIAVTRRATYQEEFEFKIDTAGNPDNIDGKGNKIFNIFYKGKKSRNSQTWDTKPEDTLLENVKFTNLGNGWYLAKGNFTIPDEIRLISSFGLKDIQGNWSKLEIRKHYISLTSDSITEEKYTDTIASLTPLADNQNQLTGILKQLSSKEIEQANIQADIIKLQEQIRQLEQNVNLSEIDKQRKIAAKQLEIKAQQDKIGDVTKGLTKDGNDCQNTYNAEVNNPLNYSCVLRCRWNENWIARIYTQDDSQKMLYADVGANGNPYYSNNRFSFQETDSGYYRIVCDWNKLGLMAGKQTQVVAFGNNTFGNNEQWSINKQANGYYTIINRATSEYLDRDGEGDYGVCTWKYAQIHNRIEWKIIQIGDITNDKISNANTALTNKQTELKTANTTLAKLQKELADLQNSSSQNTANKDLLKAQLQDLQTKYQQLDTEITTLNGTFLNGDGQSLKGVLNTVQTPQKMTRIAKDNKQLETYGAMLGFVRPVSRLYAMETCEGNVQLSYFDDQGRMRNTYYDATSDSSSGQTTFEQWLPSAQRTCVNLNNRQSLVKLNSAIDLGNEWSIEAWFTYPLPIKEYNSLTTANDDKDSESQIVVYQGKYLGTWNDGLFFNSGYNLEKLSKGWHHICAVKKDSETTSKTIFYIDGTKVGEIKNQITVLTLDGMNDYLQLDNSSMPTGNEFTISFWAKNAKINQSACLISALDSNNNSVLSIIHQSVQKDQLKITCKCGSGVSDQFSQDLVFFEGELEQWNYWTLTKNLFTKTVKIYRNGVLVCSNFDINNSLGEVKKFIIGAKAENPTSNSAYYQGQIVEVSIKDRELTEGEIQAQMGKVLTNQESYLVGYWKIENKIEQDINTVQVKDYSSKAKDGTLSGDAKSEKFSITSKNKVQIIGNVGNFPASKTITRQVQNITPSGQINPQAIAFDGVDDYIELNPSSIPNGQQLTMAFWAKGDSSLTVSTLTMLLEANNLALSVFLPWGSRIIFDCGGNRLEKTAVESEFKNQWVFWTFTKNAATGEMKIYRNGQLWHSATGFVQTIATTTIVKLGCSNGNTNYYKGQLTEVSLWKVALSAAEILDLQNKILTGSEANLTAYWRVENNQFVDKTPNAKNGTLFGNPAIITTGTPTLSVLSTTVTATVTETVDYPGESFGKLAELRFWNLALTPEEVEINSKTLVTGNEPGLIAYYPLNEGKWEAIRDNSANANTSSSADFKVMGFDGVSDYINIILNEPVTEVTHEFWFKTDSPNCGLFSAVNGNFGYNGHDRHLYLSNGNIKTRIHSSDPITSTNLHLADNQWHHIAHVFGTSISGQKIYIDGNQVADGIKAISDFNWQTGILIGYSDDAQNKYFKGSMSEVRIWQVARTQDQIKANYTKRLTGKEPGLLAYYPLDQIDSANKLVDLVGGKNGTVVKVNLFNDQSCPLNSGGKQTGGQVLRASWWGCAAPIGNLGNSVLPFNGVNDFVTIPENTLDFSGGFTVEAWVRFNNFNHYSRFIDFAASTGIDNIILANEARTNKLILHIHSGTMNVITAPGILTIGEWIHICVTIDPNKTTKIYKNGQVMIATSVPLPQTVKRSLNYIGKSNSSNNDGYFDGQLAELRLWKVARTETEIRANMNKRLTGKEANLAAYWPLNDVSGTKVTDLVGNLHGIATQLNTQNDNNLPVVGDGVISNEYSTVTIQEGLKVALMRRFFASATLNGINLLPEKRIETLELIWVGNGQFAPTLLGYIEGAPPIPSENLTVDSNYNGATSVELKVSDDVQYNWNRSTESSYGWNANLFVGIDTQLQAGFGVMSNIASVRAGITANTQGAMTYNNQSNITSSSSLNMTDRLELRGTPERDAKFPNLGIRFIPKNVGYALVVSSLSDIYITRLKRSHKMIGYQVQPVENIPPDVNTITFLINPAYTMNGSLDGLTGTSATSDRFFKQVPEMRSQYGSLYPASYYRLQEAYDLKRQIEAEDKRRESYFAHFNVTSNLSELGDSALGNQIHTGPLPTQTSLKANQSSNSNTTTGKDPAADQANIDNIETDSKGKTTEQSAIVKQKQQDIKDKLQDKDAKARAMSGLQQWQKKMEDIQIRARKRNIVNTYVWDADGGWHAESQSFADTVEHTIGGTFNWNLSLGGELQLGGASLKAELTAQATMSMTQTMSKTETHSKGIELNVDVSGVECIGITNHDDLPLMPGEKVDRYRFMSFYLEASSKNFADFFSEVVDPEWLASNDEEARALRQVQNGKPNKAWRVLHRVTYVERPALMGFGKDQRGLENDADRATSEVIQYFRELDGKQRILEAKLDRLMTYLQSKLK